MRKQFEILEQLNKLSQETETKISDLRKLIDQEFYKLKTGLINAYNNDADILYLVEFSSGRVEFYKATKNKLHEVSLSWYNSTKKGGYIYPHNYDEAVICLLNYNSPTNCEISSYNEFGYFDDIKKQYERLDWIAEKIHERKFLYEISENDFTNAIKTVSKFYGVN